MLIFRPLIPPFSPSSILLLYLILTKKLDNPWTRTSRPWRREGGALREKKNTKGSSHASPMNLSFGTPAFLYSSLLPLPPTPLPPPSPTPGACNSLLLSLRCCHIFLHISLTSLAVSLPSSSLSYRRQGAPVLFGTHATWLLNSIKSLLNKMSMFYLKLYEYFVTYVLCWC